MDIKKKNKSYRIGYQTGYEESKIEERKRIIEIVTDAWELNRSTSEDVVTLPELIKEINEEK